MKNLYIYIAVFFVSGMQVVAAQCFPDRHSTNWFDGWVSCEPSQNPISSYGETHWIMYDLGYDYVLTETQFWNSNEPKHLDYGMNEFNIDYSLDGVTWDNLGEFNLEQASGSSTYQGMEGPNFNAVRARYVLITPTSNFGGDCFGFSELKIAITDPFTVVDEEDGYNASVYPNPFVNTVSLRVVSLSQSEPVSFTLYDMMGRAITSGNITISEDNQNYQLPINGYNLSGGIYILKTNQNGKEKSFKIIKRQ
ncbi:Por secretion system C-terminal sorting domain-containing protein [Hyunsoonleella jejuensis]|uniref:Por secretion system C-terminal sorting domain-containing protein n=2 Tax=Hyunsoonleella jejuensis TaxID=419940 RepID=A0A1H9KBM3_9FLAO|nr:Por secretion system C-terminal sorting domain-containing protein [Hyunsoonleella jejuensis]